MRRQVCARGEDGVDVVVADFQLVGASVVVRYGHDPLGFVRTMFEDDGIVAGGRVLRVQDGEEFLRALDVGLASSSRWFVRDVA
jgi:hypothetical protein